MTKPLQLFTWPGQLEPSFVSRLLEHPVTAEACRLPGFRLISPAGDGPPVPVADEACSVDGVVLMQLTQEDFRRLDGYMGVGEGLSTRKRVRAEVGASPATRDVPAALYLPTTRALDQAARAAALEARRGRT